MEQYGSQMFLHGLPYGVASPMTLYIYNCISGQDANHSVIYDHDNNFIDSGKGFVSKGVD